jgi:hypothetical protein
MSREMTGLDEEDPQDRMRAGRLLSLDDAEARSRGRLVLGG